MLKETEEYLIKRINDLERDNKQLTEGIFNKETLINTLEKKVKQLEQVIINNKKGE